MHPIALAGAAPTDAPVSVTALSAELSVLAFQRRVLALAEDSATPLRARIRYLAIVAGNVDEFYMLRMPVLRDAAGAADAHRTIGDDGMTATERLSRVEAIAAGLLAAQSRCVSECLRVAGRSGVAILGWQSLSEPERSTLRDMVRDELHPALTPMAMTLSPGHPLPHLPHLALSLAVVLRHGLDDVPHLAEVEIPSDVPRMITVAGRPGCVVMLEELIRANIDLLHPNAHIDSVHVFRVTRAGDINLDEAAADDLLAAVDAATRRRPLNPAVRIEVERGTPAFVANLLLESLRRDARDQGMRSTIQDVQVIDGLLDLTCLTALPLPNDPALDYPPLMASHPFAPGESMFGRIAASDLLFHHPFDSYDDTVVRFLQEAAGDEAVTTIEITLYRVGDPSPVVDALLRAAGHGKKVMALVELKARFDEEHNVWWARALEAAGGHVVYGIVGLKTHAKVALVVRREGGRLRRYVHVCSGNYNTRSGRQYTDLSLFSARDELTADVADLFNQLTGASRAPEGLTRGALVAPRQLLPALLAMIAEETRLARCGETASIAIKVNGLSDPDVTAALAEASEAGVEIELIVRGICTMRPGVPGYSSRIRVRSVVGRFLEHSRIYRFRSGGTPRYFIGSADLRPRNLRRRVELLVPVVAPADCAILANVLGLYLADTTTWTMRPDGSYLRGTGTTGAQDLLAGHTA